VPLLRYQRPHGVVFTSTYWAFSAPPIIDVIDDDISAPYYADFDVSMPFRLITLVAFTALELLFSFDIIRLYYVKLYILQRNVPTMPYASLRIFR